MSITLDTEVLCKIMGAATLVTTGVMFKNGGAQAGMGKNTKMIGMFLFVMGWILISYFTGYSDSKISWMPVLASFTILLSVMVMMRAKDNYKGKTQPKWMMLFVLTFIIGWITLGYSVASGKSQMSMYLGISAAVLVLVSMLIVLPKQRSLGVVDGPGMPLFVLGWVALAMAKAM